MKEVIDFLNRSPLGCLATIKEGKTPNNRPFQFMVAEGGRVYFCTSNKKEVFRELRADPHACFSACGPETVYARIWGSVRFVEEMEAKTRVIESSELVKSIYKSAANPDFEVFYFDHGTAFLGDLKGTPSKEFTF